MSFYLNSKINIARLRHKWFAVPRERRGKGTEQRNATNDVEKLLSVPSSIKTLIELNRKLCGYTGYK